MNKTVKALLIFSFSCSFGFGQSAVMDFLNSLNQNQRNKTVLAFADESRESWHFFPASMLEKSGVSLAELNASQKGFLHTMLKDHLSQSGYKKAMDIITLEDVLLELEGNAKMRDSKKYYVTFYGNPKSDPIWGWSFEGHHLSLNFTSVGDRISFTPVFMGASPATVRSGKRKGMRALAQEEDLGLQLVNALDSGQQDKAIFHPNTFKEIVTFVKSEVTPLEQVGISMDALTNEQQKLLKNLISEYISNMSDGLAKKRSERVKHEKASDIYFGWAGATVTGKPHYYRIQGKTFLIEFDNTQNDANHIHSVWRDFDGDFGRDLIGEHYKKSNHQ